LVSSDSAQNRKRFLDSLSFPVNEQFSFGRILQWQTPIQEIQGLLRRSRTGD